MSTYTFRCQKCDHEFTSIFPMKDSDGKDVVCPKCGKKGVARVYKGGTVVSGGPKSSCSSCTSCRGGVCRY